MQIFKSLNTALFRLPALARVTLAAILGGTGAAAMPPLDILPALILSLSGLYVLINLSDINGRKAFLYGWFYGFGFFVAGLYWIGNALLVEGNPYKWAYPLAIIGLPVLLSFFTAFAIFFVKKLADTARISGWLLFCALFALSEYARGTVFTGFPWNLHGYVWSDSLPIAQMASVFGIYGLTLYTIMLASLPGLLIVQYGTIKRPLMIVGIPALASLVIFGLWGADRIDRINTYPAQENIIVKVIQPDIRQVDKWNPDKLEENFNTLLGLTSYTKQNSGSQLLSRDGSDAIYIIWPETALPPQLYGHPGARKIIAEMLQAYPLPAYLIAGALRAPLSNSGDRTYHNSIVVVGPTGRNKGIYDKHHLVPFGEYIPYQHYIPLGPVTSFTGLQPGTGPSLIDTGPAPPFLPLVCYEVIFPHMVQRAPDNPDIQAGWIINVTNDAWYGISAGPYQHFAKAQFRAIETGLPMIRSANTGISGIIASNGEIIEQTILNKSVSVTSPLPGATARKTLYSDYGEMLFLFLCLLMVLPSLISGLSVQAANHN